MCGIAGVFNLDGRNFSMTSLVGMANEIAHRGPDDEGFYLDDNIGLAHKRLSILDTTTKGRQPMTSKDGEWVIVFNGCIYNFLSIKEELKSKGYYFNSNSDTEVIAEGLCEYGPKIFERFNGMFAIGAWNTKERKLYLSRDRFGVKPLYYWFNGKSLVFASEIKAIIKHPDFNVEVDLDALNEYFTFQNLFTYKTLFKGVEMLPQANTVSIDSTSTFVKHHSWWDYDFSKPDYNISFEDARAETNRLFEQAVQRQMIADVPVGTYLSGGMDSGSITAVASRHVNRLTTFTCGFDMSEATGREANFDERRDAEIMANYFKTEHYEQVMNAGDIKWSLPRLVYHLEDLRVGMSYPNYYISRLASKFVKVCLQGTGGDELFGGYPWRYYKVFDSLSQKDFFNQYYGFWQRMVPDDDKDQLFTNSVYRQIDTNEPREIFERVFTFNDKLKYDTPEEHIQNSLYFEIKTFLNGLLIVGDKLSMANGLEERFPFLDNDLVDFAQQVPVKYKLGNLQSEINRINENAPASVKRKLSYQTYDDGKNVLRKAMTNLIPEKIINRKKQGFSAPEESWYRGENAEYVKEILLNGNTVSSDYINRDYISKVVDEHINKNQNHRLLIWSLLNFEWWCRIFLNKEYV
ncbi:MAG TPA: asparagine synthase (glutamine-hydrolyzing) [Balneola sp.]|jgi:asparagine synthase (glutamine-hydrolysing)|nr:asparagine synthase (glutamine-hydrolyzing) [Balneola sp.]MAO77158.1 asparagine synthase (glutamine-hydrolyzing) [Balneola sp.]MBF63393.1 asparagine synthase (glutamine-hydrolyzing) [Balneola sp.]HAH50378.1 asparagine synthase (glutamine-hydrolyzing) [Balneola sp.]|tara:strand:+ start:2538 stop:4436 length:1899 start_codon:yes stop_codon:yes gene_type:complete